jgi:hypothetical protein
MYLKQLAISGFQLAALKLLEGFWKPWKPDILYLTLQEFDKVSEELNYNFQIADSHYKML